MKKRVFSGNKICVALAVGMLCMTALGGCEKNGDKPTIAELEPETIETQSMQGNTDSGQADTVQTENGQSETAQTGAGESGSGESETAQTKNAQSESGETGNGHIPEQRLGISVSKKVGNSVVRHRITRIIRESFRSLRPGLPQDCSIVVVARPRAKDRSFSDICDALRYLCKKLNSYTDPQKTS